MGCQAFDVRDRLRVLDREQGDHGHAVDSQLLEGFEVRLKTGPATGVGTRDGQRNGLRIELHMSGVLDGGVSMPVRESSACLPN